MSIDMSSLQKDIKEFSERARRILMESVEKENKADTKTVEVIGYNSDGKMIAKDRDETKTVKETGDTYLRRGTRVTLDQSNTADTPKRKRTEEVQLEPLGTVKKPATLGKSKGDQFNQQEVLAKNVQSQDVWWISYRKCRPDQNIHEQFSYETAKRDASVFLTDTTFPSPPADINKRHDIAIKAEYDINSPPTVDNTQTERSWVRQDPTQPYTYFLPYGSSADPYGFMHGSAKVFNETNSYWAYPVQYATGAGWTQMYAGASSVSYPYNLGGAYYMTGTSVGFSNAHFPSYGNKYQDVSYIRIGGYHIPQYYTDSNGNSVPYRAYIEADWGSAYYPFDNDPYYYYQTIDDQGQRGGWVIDLRDYFLPNAILKCERIHNFNTITLNAADEEEFTNYSIFFVTTCVAHTTTYTGGNVTSSGYSKEGYSGSLGHYLVYTKLGLYTGDLSYHTVSLGPNPANANDMCVNTLSGNGTNASTAGFPNGALVSWKGGQRTYTMGRASYNGYPYDFGAAYLDWSPLFSNAFPGDWLLYVQSFTMNNFTPGSVSDLNDLFEFISLSETGLYLENTSTFNAIPLAYENCENYYYYAENLKISASRVNFGGITDINDIRSVLSNLVSHGITHNLYWFLEAPFTTYKANTKVSGLKVGSRTSNFMAPYVGELYVDQPELNGCSEDRAYDYGYCNYLGSNEFQFHRLAPKFHVYSPIDSYRVYEEDTSFIFMKTVYDTAFDNGDTVEILLNSAGFNGTYVVYVIDSRTFVFNSSGSATEDWVSTDGYAVLSF